MKKALLLLSILISAYANAQTYKIGDLIEFPDKTFGVVFYLNQQTGDGLAVSMDEIETQWEAADDEEDCHMATPISPTTSARRWHSPTRGTPHWCACSRRCASNYSSPLPTATPPKIGRAHV